MRGGVKSHEPTPQGRVARLHAQQGFGFHPDAGRP
jgi:hypothetical protein